MTVGRPRDPEHLPAPYATGTGATEAPDALALIDDIDAAGSSADARAGLRDTISLSARARMLLRAGLVVRALILDVLASTYRTLSLGQRTIVLEFGVYR
jgi:hypothetical protein